ncbi:MAG TPA: hypothetical protein V6D48_17435 [Oculatellaceae cyanobacterium]
MPILKIDGQELELDEAMAASDELLRQGLAPFYPFMQNALIERKTDKDGQLVIEVVKRAGTKGAITPLSVLIDAKEEVNEAIALAWILKRQEAAGEIEASHIVQMYGQIEEAIATGREEESLIDAAWSFLTSTVAQVSVMPINGV